MIFIDGLYIRMLVIDRFGCSYPNDLINKKTIIFNKHYSKVSKAIAYSMR